LLEQNPAAVKNKRMFFGNSLCAWPRSFDWKRRWIFCTAEFFDWADGAFRFVGEANERAEVDKRRVVRPSVGFWNETRRMLPKRFPPGAAIDGLAKIQKPCQDASGIRFDDCS
jgi:hypothetical protein